MLCSCYCQVEHGPPQFYLLLVVNRFGCFYYLWICDQSKQPKWRGKKRIHLCHCLLLNIKIKKRMKFSSCNSRCLLESEIYAETWPANRFLASERSVPISSLSEFFSLVRVRSLCSPNVFPSSAGACWETSGDLDILLQNIQIVEKFQYKVH